MTNIESSISSDDPMKLMEICKIYLNENHKMKLYIIHFKNQDNNQGYLARQTLAATMYHAFVVIRNGEQLALETSDLQKGDMIWVDVHAFTKDGSLTNYERGVQKCVTGRHPILTECGWKSAEDIDENDKLVTVHRIVNVLFP